MFNVPCQEMLQKKYTLYDSYAYTYVLLYTIYVFSYNGISYVYPYQMEIDSMGGTPCWDLNSYIPMAFLVKPKPQIKDPMTWLKPQSFVF